MYHLPVSTAKPATIAIRLVRLGHAEGIDLPEYETPGASGADVRSAERGPVIIAPGDRVAVATGLVMEIPSGWEVQVRPRSGLAWRNGLTVINAPGTIDSDYRGEVRVLLVNLGSEPVTVERGERIAQLVATPVARASFAEVTSLGETGRGHGGFGSTGRG